MISQYIIVEWRPLMQLCFDTLCLNVDCTLAWFHLPASFPLLSSTTNCRRSICVTVIRVDYSMNLIYNDLCMNIGLSSLEVSYPKSLNLLWYHVSESGIYNLYSTYGYFMCFPSYYSNEYIYDIKRHASWRDMSP